ncbi:metal ABC transporter substrate-binding protein [Cellulomonas cellasea]|uniref:Metal ABC transporter substrate-binding protein n=1 Tax=Cellulomonas cellasea TaxID=43670 RepID=A0A4Y3L0Y3_9CELL|nr:metal ABC transporter substrate-binding protein [Cellulomonas cellasea]GEA89316.1 metal ABC transporter substrate-binding protein [Cellulomonas cellasea]
MPNSQFRTTPVRRLALLAGTAALVLAGCTGPGERAAAAAAPGDDRPVVLATFTVLADMARVVGGGHVRVESVTKVGSEIHGYEPTPDDLRRAQDADLVLDNGLGLEAWFHRFVDRVDAPHVTLTDGIETVPIASGAAEGHANPHAWMSPDAAATYVANIADALVDLDPAHADEYRANAAAYAAQVTVLGERLRDELAGLDPEQRALVTCEGAFSYLARDAGLAEASLWPVNAERQGTPQQVARAIDLVRDRDVPAVFCESTVSPTAQEQVARETGARLGGVLYVDSLSEPDGPVPTYLDLLEHDVHTIIEGLTGEETS